MHAHCTPTPLTPTSLFPSSSIYLPTKSPPNILLLSPKVVDEVRLLSRPRGVDHMSSLINKGAFNSVLAVMEPTEEAALTVLDIVSSCVEVSEPAQLFDELVVCTQDDQ